MEYAKQRQILRSQRVSYEHYGATWDFSDLDGGCDLWRRFQERRLPPGVKNVCRPGAQQFQEILKKEAMAKRMWAQRAKDNADQQGWWLEARYFDDSSSEVMEREDDDKDGHSVVHDPLAKENVETLHADKYKDVSPAKDDARGTVGWRIWSDKKDGKNKYVVDDGNCDDDNDDDDDDDEEKDEFSTIYSYAREDPLASPQVFSSNLQRISTTNVNSYVTASCTLQSMSLVYHSFNWAEDVEDAEGASMAAALTPLAPELSAEIGISNQLAFREFLTQYVHQARLQYETERRIEAVDKNRTLDVRRLRGGILPICDWKFVPLSETYEDCERYALRRPTKGACAYERTPVVVVTNEDRQHFRLLEVRKILTEERIAEIRAERDPLQNQLQKDVEKYELYNIAKLEGQCSAERRSVDAAKAWWSAEQKKRDITYIDWEHAEAQEVELLKRQIEREVDLRFKSKERSDAKRQMRDYAKQAKAARIQHLANLKLNLMTDELDYIGSGRYIGSKYDVTLDSHTFYKFLKYRDDIDSMAYAIATHAETVGAKARAKREREEL
jgi:hypothetical protein